MDVYKVNNNSWSKAVHLPQSLHHSNIASLINSNIYVIGGDRPSKTFNNNKKILLKETN